MSTWEACCTTESWRSSKAGELLLCFLKDTQHAWRRRKTMINYQGLTKSFDFGLNLFGSGSTCALRHVPITSGYMGSCLNCGTYIFRHNLSGTTGMTDTRQLAILWLPCRLLKVCRLSLRWRNLEGSKYWLKAGAAAAAWLEFLRNSETNKLYLQDLKLWW